MSYSSKYWIEAVDGRTFMKVDELLPFETQVWAVEKVEGYEPSIDDVMIFGEDYHNDTSFDTTSWTGTTTGATISSGVLSYTGSGSNSVMKTTSDFSLSTVAEYNARIDTGGTGAVHFIGYGDGVGGSPSADPNNWWYYTQGFYTTWEATPRILAYPNGIDVAVSYTIGSYQTYKVERVAQTVTKYYVNDALISTQNANTSNSVPMQIMNDLESAILIKNLFIRKYASTEPTVTVEDMGTWYKVLITNNVGETLTDYQIQISSADLDIADVDESLRIVQIDHGVSFEPHKDLFEDCIMYLDFMGDDKDVIGNYDGTVTGATLTSDNFGITNAAYSYDGTDDYCALSTIPELQNGSQTFIFKVPPHPSHATGLIQHRNVVVTLSTLHYMAVQIWTGRDGAGSYIGCNTVMSIDDDVWHIATIGWDVDENYYVIIDGNEVEVTPTSSTSEYSHNYNYLMRWRYTSGDANYYTSGQVALFMMFNTYNKERDLVLNKLLSRGYPYPIMTNTSGGLLE